MVHGRSERAVKAASCLCREATLLDVALATFLDVALSSPLVLKESWAHFLSLVSSKGGTATEFRGFKQEDTLSLQGGRNVAEELGLHYRKVPQAFKVREKRAWPATSGACGFIELVMKIMFAK